MNHLLNALRLLWRLCSHALRPLLLLSFLLACTGLASAQAPAPAGLPTLTSSQPADGAQNVGSSTDIELRLNAPLTPAQRRGLTATLLGPAGPVAAQFEPSGERLLRIRPEAGLLPGAAYTLIVQASPGTAPWIALGFRTRALDAAAPQASAELDDEPDQGFNPGAQHRKGQWRTGALHGHSRDAQARALEQQTVLERLPAAARQRLLTRMEQAGEAVTLDPRGKLALRREASRSSAPARTSADSTQATSLTGQVLALNGRPLSRVVLSVGGRSTETGADGEFELTGLAAGTQVLVIDGRRAGRRNQDFGRYEYKLDLSPGVNDLPHTIWLTRIDHRHAVRLASPTQTETVVSHPAIPGLELRIPAGAVILGADGRLVREVSITPIPADQMPFPMPYADVPLYYSIQPGGARIVSATGQPIGATLHYPNYSTQPPGAKLDLFDYDPRGRGWYTYGIGTVSADGARIESREPFTIYQFAMSSAASPGGPAPGPPDPCCGGGGGGSGGGAGGGGGGPGDDDAGDPVTVASGLFSERNTDLTLPDTVPIRLEREYRQNDTNQRAFGIGSNGFYNQYLYFEGLVGYTAQAVHLVLPSSASVRFAPISANIDLRLTASIFESNEPGPFMKARFAISAAGYGNDLVVTTKGGERYGFSYFQSRLKWMEDRHGNRTTVLRDGSGRVSRVISPHGRFVEFLYTAPSCTTCITRATDHTGRFFQYDYDTPGRLTRVTAPDSTHVDYTYDSAHRMLTVTNARNHRKVLNEYWLATGNTALDGRVRRQTYADNTTHDFAYEFDAQGLITASEVTDQRGVVRRREYNAARYIVRDVFAQGTPQQAAFVFQRDPASQLIMQTTDPLGRVTRFEYDTLGNQTSRTVMFGTAQATTWLTSYEPMFNQPLVSTDPLGRRITRVYDAQGRLSETRNELGHRTTYTWHPEGQMETITRWPGVPTASTQLTTRFGYDYGDLVQIADPLNRVTRLNVDALGRVTGTRDAANQLSTTEYNSMDRVVQRCDASQRCADQAYDANGNLTQFSLGSTQRSFTYDPMNRMLTEGNGSPPSVTVESTFAYEPGGLTRLVTETSGRQTESLYDAKGRMRQQLVRSGNPLVLRRTVDYLLDAMDRLQSITDSVSGALSYTYDNRFDSVLTETGPTGTMTYAYLANGLLDHATPSGGTRLSKGYDSANRLQSITQAAGAGSAQPTSAQMVQFAYDEAGRRSRLTLPNGITVDYSWDAADQLGSLIYRLNGSVIGDLGYGYDVLGRRTSSTGSFSRTQLPPVVDLPVGTDGRTQSENGVVLSYDTNGRLTQDAQFNYAWNELGQLTELRNRSDNALRASYLYDPAGRRVQKTLDGLTTRYLHDGANPVQLQEANGTARENLMAGSIDEWFSRTIAGQTQHFLTDALRSTLRLTDPAGVKLVDYNYDAYGGTTNDNASVNNPFQYTGRENDGLGLYFYRARYYKPGWGRFISSDPIGLVGGDNLYAYVGGNPVSRIDPKGLAASCPHPCPPDKMRKYEDCVNNCNDSAMEGVIACYRFPLSQRAMCISYFTNIRFSCLLICRLRFPGCSEQTDPPPSAW